jgi:hypothetical protein
MILPAIVFKQIKQPPPKTGDGQWVEQYPAGMMSHMEFRIKTISEKKEERLPFSDEPILLWWFFHFYIRL